jgi:hypothetical protein
MELNELNFGSEFRFYGCRRAQALGLRVSGVRCSRLEAGDEEEEAEVREALRLHSHAMMSSSSNTGTDFSAHIHSNLRRSQGQTLGLSALHKNEWRASIG